MEICSHLSCHSTAKATGKRQHVLRQQSAGHPVVCMVCAGRWRRAQGVEVECTAGAVGRMAACGSPATAPSAVRGVYPEGMAFVLPPYDGRARARPAREGGAESKNEMIRRFDLTLEGY